MASSIPFVRGQNCVLRLYSNGKFVYLLAKNWELEENATENADGVNGENRDRLDKVTNYYSGSVDTFQQDQQTLEAYMESQDADDNNELPLNQTGAVMFKHRDGTRACWLLQEMKLGPIKETLSSRQEAMMLNVKFRFRFMKQVPAI